MTTADLNALLAEPKVRDALALLDLAALNKNTVAFEGAKEFLATAIAEAVERRFAPLVTAHAEWVAAHKAQEAAMAAIEPDDGDEQPAFLEYVALGHRLGEASNALYNLAPLTDTPERRESPPPDPDGATPDRGGRRSAHTLHRTPLTDRKETTG